MEPRKYDYIDSLRGIAILIVIMVHTAQATVESHFPGMLHAFLHSGKFGVQLFFLVSAFTLMMSYDSREKEQYSTRNFYIRRYFRIAPMYYLAIIYYCIQNYVGFQFFSTGETLHPFPLSGAFANMFFIHGIKPEWINSIVPGGWSITVEITFYLFLPFICKLVTNINRSLCFFLLSILLCGVLSRLLAGTYWDSHNFLYFCFLNQLPVFALGIFAYYVIKEGVNSISSRMQLFSAIVIFMFCLFHWPEHIRYTFGFFALLITLSRFQFKFLVNPFTVHIGKLSYSIYLVHFAILYWLSKYNFTSIIEVIDLKTGILSFSILYMVVLLASSLVSQFTYQFVEVPCQNIGKKVIRLVSKQSEKLEIGVELVREAKQYSPIDKETLNTLNGSREKNDY